MPDTYEIVNSTQLNNDLLDIADAIRAKSQGQDPLLFPSEFISEIGSIPTGASITGQTDVTIKAMETIAERDTVFMYRPMDALVAPTTRLAGTANGCAFSPDGTRLAIACNSSPYIYIFDATKNPYTKLADPGTLPVNVGNGCAFSPDGTRLAVAHNSSPYITIYDTTTTPYTKLANPGTLPAGNGFDCAFSADGTRLAVAHNSYPYITTYNTSNQNQAWKALNKTIGLCSYGYAKSSIASGYTGTAAVLFEP